MCETTRMPGGDIHWKEFGDVPMVVPAAAIGAMAHETDNVEAMLSYVPSGKNGRMVLSVASAPGAYSPEIDDSDDQISEPSVLKPVLVGYAMLLDAASGYIDEEDEANKYASKNDLSAAS